ncbi:16S rRNA (guanine(966)-N(2))-methyltransferase RsmD [[Clostridium] colinum]|uniref:16S rRNA (guanine(966)-N(2))-methyltransferase RsmD n=1 Tax=[Clostridium] colinum TaxID=36835 RepID=UPI00202429DF|nr:16S rRNA (guanine(966)-N(2))-methyltransferase RsmD [[Clostridium] colinum]
MRVISGSARGLKLKSPQGLNTRPTTDRIKESLFNIIAPYLYDCSFLDLFSGSGAIGIEALSRGAKDASFVDSDKDSINLIKQNISLAKFEKKSTIYNLTALDAINKFSINNKKFDIIFLDPPYDKGLLLPVLKKIEDNEILKNDGFIICEQHINEPEIILQKLYTYRIKEYKTTKMVFLEYK